MPNRDHDRTDSTSPADAGRPPAAMASLLIALPPHLIALFKAIIESYDNLATLRTEDPARHHLRLYFAPESTPEIEALLDSLAGPFALRRLA